MNPLEELPAPLEPADLYDAARVGAAALASVDWQKMDSRAVAYTVLSAALPYLRGQLDGRQDDEAVRLEQAARDAMHRRHRQEEADRPAVGAAPPAGLADLVRPPASQEGDRGR